MNRKTTHILYLLLVVTLTMLSINLVTLTGVLPATPALAAIPIEDAVPLRTFPTVGGDQGEDAPSTIHPATTILTGTVGVMPNDDSAPSGVENLTPAGLFQNLVSGATRNFKSTLDTGDPLSVGDGAYHFDLPLLSLGGPMNLDFILHYRSDFSQLVFWETVAGLPRRFWWSPLENMEYHYDDPDVGGAFASIQVRNGDAISFEQKDGQWVPTAKDGFGYEDNVYPIRWLLQETAGYFYLMDPLGEQVHIFEKVSAPDPNTPGYARIARIVDRNGNQLIYSYAEAADLYPSRVEDGLGRSLDFSYQTVGSWTALVRVTDQAGRQVTFTHEAQGADNGNQWTLRSVTDPLNQTSTFHYTTVQKNEFLTWYDQITRVDWPKGNAPYTQTYEKVTYNGVGIPAVTSQQDAYSNTMTLDYDPAAYRVTETRPDGATMVYEHYSAHGLPKALTDPMGKTTVGDRDEENNHTTSITDRLGNTETYTYHPQTGMLASVTDADGQTTAFTYTAQEQTFSVSASRAGAQAVAQDVTFTFYNLTDVAYADGTHEHFTFDAHGNVTAHTDRRGATWSFTYNDRGQPLTLTNPNGGVITFTYDADATLTSSTDPEVGVTTYGYDVYKRLISVTQPDNEVINSSYDLNNRLLTLTNELGQTSVATYDANGILLTVTDALSETVTFAHDLMDRMVSLTDPVGQVANFSYDEMGRLASVTDRNGNVSTYAYDTRGWLTSTTDPAGEIWAYGYDDEGRLTSMTTPLDHRTLITYDALGHVTRVTDPLGEHSDFSYDALGRLLSATDRLGRETTYSYDEEGNLVGVSKAEVGSAAYSRDALGEITRFTDPRGYDWDLAYSPMGRLTTFTDPLGNSWSFAYDIRGRLQTTTYPGGQVLTHSYDEAGNLIRLAYGDGTTLDYDYDDVGRLVVTNDLALTYDARGDVTTSQDGATAFGATYDAGQRLETVTYPSTGTFDKLSTSLRTGDGQTTVTYTYDERDLLTRVEDDLVGAWMTFSYDDDGRLTEMQRSNGVTTTFTYDAAGRVTRIQDGTISDQQYTLDGEGEPTQVVRTLPLDPPPTMPPLNLTYDEASQISSPGYGYDARGRQTAAPGRTFTWNDAAQLTSITAGGSTATFTYNGLGDLRTRTVGGATTTYYHNYALGLDPIVAESLPSPKGRSAGGEGYERFYVYSPGGSLLYSIDPTGGGVRFYHFDWVGSTLFLTDGNGVVTDAYAYTPYGHLIDHAGSSDQPFTYVGRYGVRWEPVGGLYDMRVRYYDPNTQRFLSRDPLWGIPGAVEDLNPYLYAADNPLRYIDPVGLNFWDHRNKNIFGTLKQYGMPSLVTGGLWRFPPGGWGGSPGGGWPGQGGAFPNVTVGQVKNTVSNLGSGTTVLEYGGKLLPKVPKLTKPLTKFGKLVSKTGTVLTVAEGLISFGQQGYQVGKGIYQGNLAAYHYSQNKGAPGARLVGLFYDDPKENAAQVKKDLHSFSVEGLGANMGYQGYELGNRALKTAKHIGSRALKTAKHTGHAYWNGWKLLKNNPLGLFR